VLLVKKNVLIKSWRGYSWFGISNMKNLLRIISLECVRSEYVLEIVSLSLSLKRFPFV
jgi:hypothetical protein